MRRFFSFWRSLFKADACLVLAPSFFSFFSAGFCSAMGPRLKVGIIERFTIIRKDSCFWGGRERKISQPQRAQKKEVREARNIWQGSARSERAGSAMRRQDGGGCPRTPKRKSIAFLGVRGIPAILPAHRRSCPLASSGSLLNIARFALLYFLARIMQQSRYLVLILNIEFVLR